MGVQSFDAGLLEACGRAHSLADVYQAVEVLRKTEMDNFSIDLMRYFCSVKGANPDSWGLKGSCTRTGWVGFAALLIDCFSADPFLTRRFSFLKN